MFEDVEGVSAIQNKSIVTLTIPDRYNVDETKRYAEVVFNNGVFVSCTYKFSSVYTLDEWKALGWLSETIVALENKLK